MPELVFLRQALQYVIFLPIQIFDGTFNSWTGLYSSERLRVLHATSDKVFSADCFS